MVSIFRKYGFFAEVADQVKGCPERNEILEKEQAQETHAPHMVNSGNGNNRAGGGCDHRAGCEKHEYGDESAQDTGFRPEIARDIQERRGDLGKTDDTPRLRAPCPRNCFSPRTA